MNDYPLYRETKEYGNDCMIYKTFQLVKIANKYVVVVLEIAEGSWIRDNVQSIIRQFEDESEALEYWRNFV